EFTEQSGRSEQFKESHKQAKGWYIIIGEMILSDRPVRVIQKSSWFIMTSCIFSSFIYTIWGGCLLLACLVYLAISKRFRFDM
ncbi:hypothetical protein AB4Z22_25445, partial [Paenibacillus sp. TAF58]